MSRFALTLCVSGGIAVIVIGVAYGRVILDWMRRGGGLSGGR